MQEISKYINRIEYTLNMTKKFSLAECMWSSSGILTKEHLEKYAKLVGDCDILAEGKPSRENFQGCIENLILRLDVIYRARMLLDLNNSAIHFARQKDQTKSLELLRKERKLLRAHLDDMKQTSKRCVSCFENTFGVDSKELFVPNRAL